MHNDKKYIPPREPLDYYGTHSLVFRSSSQGFELATKVINHCRNFLILLFKMFIENWNYKSLKNVFRILKNHKLAFDRFSM